MLLAPALGAPPREVAERLGGRASSRAARRRALERVEVAGPGFLNLFLADAWYARALAACSPPATARGGGRAPSAERVNVEFVSANPTGPLTAASGRHAAYGDALARMLEFAGHDVEREYYVNDYGSQVAARRVDPGAARGEEPPEDGYQGDYVAELARADPRRRRRDPTSSRARASS
jgi:arginyl-tRNA synthetase